MAAAKESNGVAGDGGTVIGPAILVNGRITGDDDLTVQGRVEGEVNLTRTLVVEASGVVKAEVSVRNAIISGVVVGNVTAEESVEVTPEGRMVGDIRAPRVILIEGASFRGRIDMGNAEPGRVAAERPARPAARSGRTATATATVTVPAVNGTGRAPPPPPPPGGRADGRRVVARGTSAADFRGAPPPPPPAPATVGAGSKRKVVVKKRGR